VDCDVKDQGLAQAGRDRIDWAAREMPVVGMISERFEKERPLTGLRVGACLHVTSETANLLSALTAGGAEVAVCASNPLSTQDDVAAALCEQGIAAFAIRGEDDESYYGHIRAVLDRRPSVTLDDGADLVSTLHRHRQEQLSEVIGGTEETTTGVIRLRAMAREGVLGYPIVAVNDARTKRLFDNRFGTGQSTIDGIIRATNLLLAGRVVVTEVSPVAALEAAMEGYEVLSLREAARQGDVFVTVTGGTGVVRAEHLEVMKDGAVLANAGHFDVEIDKRALEELAVSRRRLRVVVDEYRMADGRRIHLLAEGRLVNLAAAEGHPAAVMDMSFGNQALCVEWIAREGRSLERAVHTVPESIDDEVARLKLQALGMEIDTLTPEQEAYLRSWEQGT
jgi:adenosylhomocysteinase